jgi:integrase/recombinase XerD
VLRSLCGQRRIDGLPDVHLFVNRRGQPLSRFGVRHILSRCVKSAAGVSTTLEKKRLHPHSTAVALLKSTVDLSTIIHMLGHAGPDTTNRYAEVDIEMKRKAIAKVMPMPRKSRTLWAKDATILNWLESL